MCASDICNCTYIIAIVMFVVGITEVICGTVYKDLIVCDLNYISLAQWLIISGSSALFGAFVTIILSSLIKKNKCTCISVLVYIVVIIHCVFQILCSVGGGILIWEYCRTDINDHMKTYIFVLTAILIQFIFGMKEIHIIMRSLCSSRSKSDYIEL